MGNCTEICCDNKPENKPSQVPYFKVCVLHDESFQKTDEKKDNEKNDNRESAPHYILEVPVQTERVLLSVWTQYFFKDQNPKWYNNSNIIKE